jgi:hypothetical protein
MADRGVPSIFEVLRKSGLNVPSEKTVASFSLGQDIMDIVNAAKNKDAASMLFAIAGIHPAGKAFKGMLAGGKRGYDKSREAVDRRGGPLRSKPGLKRIAQALDDHDIDWEYDDINGGIRAFSEYTRQDRPGQVFKSAKHFAENTSLKTLRDWLGY